MFSLPFIPDLKFWCWLWVISAYFYCLSSPHLISWEVRAVSTKTRCRQSTGAHWKFLPSISFMSAFTIVYHIPNQIRLKTIFYFFFNLIVFEKILVFSQISSPSRVIGLLWCGDGETRSGDRADLNQYKVIEQQQLNIVLCHSSLFAGEILANSITFKFSFWEETGRR